jgi:hypothetical protein
MSPSKNSHEPSSLNHLLIEVGGCVRLVHAGEARVGGEQPAAHQGHLRQGFQPFRGQKSRGFHAGIRKRRGFGQGEFVKFS